MQYHPDTIPVWEAMERQSECPLCALERKVELEEVERTLGASLMESAERLKVNRHGICREHHAMLYMQQNRLGHALLMDSHGKERLAALRMLQATAESAAKTRRGFWNHRKPARSLGAELQALSQGCVVCDRIHEHMSRYRHTFLHLWQTDAHFRDAWLHSRGVCLKHLAGLVQSAERRLPPARQAQFAAEALASLTGQLANDAKDLDWFTRKFDYRNQTSRGARAKRRWNGW